MVVVLGNNIKVGDIEVPLESIASFCRKWNVAELSLFGSALRDDFAPGSDVDVLVTFGVGGAMTFEGFLEM